MPTYDYKCTQCGYKFEFFQPMSAEPLSECPQCNGQLKRLIGLGAGPIFKGSGFYQTDYKNKSGSTSGKNNGGNSVEKRNSDKTASKEKPKSD
jgi:putative FmdB family regulatory protein